MNLLVSLDGIPANVFGRFSEMFLRRGYSYVAQLQTTFPSVTYTAHMSAITGEDPIGHGVFENIIANNTDLRRQALYTADKSIGRQIITAKTLFETLDEAGLKTTSMDWPLANCFSRSFMKEEHAAHEESSSMETAIKNDEKIFDNLCQLIHSNQTDFIAVHFLQYDASAHICGVYAPETQKALEKLVEYTLEITIRAGRHKNANLIFFSDHGMVDRTGSVFPNQWIAQNGFEKEVRDKLVRFVCDGSGSALFYSKLTEEENEDVLKCLSKNAAVKGIYSFESLFQNKYVPKAVVDFSGGTCAEDILPGQEAQYPDMKGLHGHHGNCTEEMNGFLMAYGAGIKESVSVTSARIIDIAPTMAHLCGCRHPCSGDILRYLLAP